MATQPPVEFDAAALRAEGIEAFRSIGVPAPEPSAVTPSATVDAPVVPAEPVPGSHPEAVAAPSEPVTAAGSHPAEPVPAAVIDPDLTHALELAGAQDVPEAERVSVLAKKLLEYNTRNAELAKAQKETPAPPATPAPTQPQPQALAQTQAVPEPPARPVPVEEAEAIEKQVQDWELNDYQCRAFASQYDAAEKQITAIVRYDESGRLVGSLPDLEDRIKTVEAFLGPADELRKQGVPIPELDELQIQDIRTRLILLQTERVNKVGELREWKAVRKEAEDSIVGRRGEARQYIRDQYDVQRRATERETSIETDTTRLEQDWKREFAAVAQSMSISPEDQPDYWNALKGQAALDLSCFDDLRPWMERGFKANKEQRIRYHRRESAEYAKLKTADAAQAAPPAQAAVAPPLAINSDDWEKRLRAHARGAGLT